MLCIYRAVPELYYCIIFLCATVEYLFAHMVKAYSKTLRHNEVELATVFFFSNHSKAVSISYTVGNGWS